jgi:hypothetical protein
MSHQIIPRPVVELGLLFEWAGAATGVLGSLLLALNNSWSGFGFVAFLASNLFWISYGVMRQARGLISMQLVFTITSVIGITRWLVHPG